MSDEEEQKAPGATPQQPQAIKVEQVVLGALLIDRRCWDDAIPILTLDCFLCPKNREIYKVIDELYSKDHPIDLVIVNDFLEKNKRWKEIGDVTYLVDITMMVSSGAHITYHCRILHQKAMQRHMLALSSSINKDILDMPLDVFNLIEKAEKSLSEISEIATEGDLVWSRDIFTKTINTIEENKKGEGDNILTGFSHVDKIMGGLKNSDLVVVASRPGMGKTAFMLNIALNTSVKQDIPVAIFSLEMNTQQLMVRMISHQTGFRSEDIAMGNLTEGQWEALHLDTKRLQEAPFCIDDTPNISIASFAAKAKRSVMNDGIKLIMIDYLQYMTVPESNKYETQQERVAFISRRLKSIAKSLNIPIIALAQLSRAVETRGNKRPLLSDIRESGAIEQDADIVTFLYRPEYYGIQEWDDEEAGPTKNQAEFIVAKHRNGAVGSARLRFYPGVMTFADMQET